MGIYLVKIKATVVKSFNVVADSEEEAINSAQLSFDLLPTEAERYEEEILHVEEISK